MSVRRKVGKGVACVWIACDLLGAWAVLLGTASLLADVVHLRIATTHAITNAHAVAALCPAHQVDFDGDAPLEGGKQVGVAC